MGLKTTEKMGDGEAEAVISGDDVKKVVPKTVCNSLETVRESYARLIQEAGERGISAQELQEVSTACDAVLSEVEPTEEGIEAADQLLTEAFGTVRIQDAMKTEDGQSYPSSAYAYVPDKEKPSGWKLRLWEDSVQKVTVAQLGRAAAALSPGGFRGNRVQIPSAALPAVKAKIRAAYSRLGIKSEDMSRWVKEAEELREAIGEEAEIDIKEVTVEGIAKGIVPVRIISPGFNYSKNRYYSEQSVQDAAKLFDGAKMYADHATDKEETEKPERSIRDWVATLHETKVSESGNAVGVAHINAGWLKEKIVNLFEQGDLKHLGTSINAVGNGTVQTIEGIKTILIEGLVQSTFQSVDFVTEAGAGGQAGLMESIREHSVDVDLMNMAQLKEARPDLVTSIQEEAKETIRQEAKEVMETQVRVSELEKENEELTRENTGLKEQITEGERGKAKAEAQVTIKETVDRADLPEATKVRLLARFADAENIDGLEEAIQGEADYLATLRGDGIVKGLGPPAPEQNDEEALKESFKRMHPEWTGEQVENAVRGR